MRGDSLVASAPSQLHKLFALAGERWTREQRAIVVRWLCGDQVKSNLRVFVASRLRRARWRSDAVDVVLRDFMRLIEHTSILGRYQPGTQRPFARRFANYIFRQLDAFIGIQDRRTSRYRASLPRRKQEVTTTEIFGALGSPRMSGSSVGGSSRLAAIAKRSVNRSARVRSRRMRNLFVADITPREVAGERPTKRAGDWIECTLFGQRDVPPGKRAMIQAFVHSVASAAAAAKMATEFDTQTGRLATKGLGAIVPRGTRLRFALSLPGARVKKQTQTVIWRGATTNVSFGIEVPGRAKPGPIIGTVVVSARRVPLGQLNFRINVAPDANDSQQFEGLAHFARGYRQAFISYASTDRNKVLGRVQILRLFGIDCFQDVLNLEPGDRWAQQLYRRIDECDLFLLFWSMAARRSRWVIKEARYALARKNGDEGAPPDIHPVILDRSAPKPPRCLQHLHFSDPLVHFMTRKA